MKKIMFFVGIVGILSLGTSAEAKVNDNLTPEDINGSEYAKISGTALSDQLPDDSPSTPYPTYGDSGTKDTSIKVATTKYIDSEASTTSSNVGTLKSSANTSNTTVATNDSNLVDMVRDRQVAVTVPTDCKTTANGGNMNTDVYSGCAYMVKNGSANDGVTATNYIWYKIVK